MPSEDMDYDIYVFWMENDIQKVDTITAYGQIHAQDDNAPFDLFEDGHKGVPGRLMIEGHMFVKAMGRLPLRTLLSITVTTRILYQRQEPWPPHRPRPILAPGP
ncbi:hypothetical protein CC86DRAFT_414117 [Ophiobolus disseminans]|uniref:Uncharacterized protein n=1 Tax=Ophiobolus disseminans TaxID=1469910 RepID=A0A6A6ZAT7_9PLEO|nr:hypothetical protein CC86DRAFT_414117 [Ophiobolus disseminans]